VELREALAALRAGWWLPLAGLVIGGGAALVVSLLQTPLYTSSTQLFVSTRDSASTSDALSGSMFSQQRVSSYAQLIEGQDLATRVINRLQLDTTPSELQREITATTTSTTVLISVSVTDSSPERAQQIAKAVGTEFASLAAQLEAPGDGGAAPVKVTVTDTPEVPSEASSPKTTRNVALGLLGGLLLGIGVSIVRALLDRTVKDPDEATELAGAPLVGLVLRDQFIERRHLADRALGSRSAEDYRQLRNNLQFLNVDEPPKVIMVSSALPSEGKTTLVVNLALALADAGRRVVVVEADLRRPKVTRYLALVGGVGLTNVLTASADLHEVLQRYGDAGISVLGSGPLPPNPGELLGSTHMGALLDKLRSESDFVLVDAPPLLPVADASGLAVHVDGVLLSIRYGSTRKEQVQQAVATVERVGAKMLGVVLNIVPPKAQVMSAYGYGYEYGYDRLAERDRPRRAAEAGPPGG